MARSCVSERCPIPKQTKSPFLSPASKNPVADSLSPAFLASFCLATGMILQWVTGHWYQHELSLLPELLESFNVGDVLLGDRGFGNFPVLAQCLDRKLDGVLRANTAKRRLNFR